MLREISFLNQNSEIWGLYQLRVGDAKALFFVLDEKPATVTLNADSADLKNYTYKISGSPASEQLRQFIAETKRYGDAFGVAMGEYTTHVNDSTPDSLRKFYEAKLLMADSNFRSYATHYIDTVKNPIISIFAVSNLDFNHDRASFNLVEERLKKDYASLPFAQAYLTMMAAQKQQEAQSSAGEALAWEVPCLIFHYQTPMETQGHYLICADNMCCLIFGLPGVDPAALRIRMWWLPMKNINQKTSPFSVSHSTRIKISG